MNLSTPLIAASGTFGYGDEHKGLCDLDCLGAIAAKGISLLPRIGNLPPRIHETPSGLLNAIGLENVGVEAFLEDKLPFLAKARPACIVNILGESFDEYAQLSSRLDGIPGIDMLEVNVSCPNVEEGGLSFGVDPDLVAKVTKTVKSATALPVMLKLTPMAGAKLAETALAAQEAGADAISLINTIGAMEIDIERKRPVLGNVSGGLSGPAIRPVALKMVFDVASMVDIPVVGIGGITSARDVIAFLLAGASAVQVGTGLLIDPDLPCTMLDGIEDYMDRHGIARLSDITGALELP
ncbi:MAG: dihydroorotate dehydrogenase [Deltaproteobacteria bacterium]|nr:dihydroorotate dehydrogenase [Deltaproteobacteria bacterium]